MKRTCPYCNEEVDIDSNFQFKLVPTHDHPRSGCCNLCDAEIIESCSMERRGDEDMKRYKGQEPEHET